MGKRCPVCFNEYTSWAPNYCSVCARNENDARRYHNRYKSSTEKYSVGKGQKSRNTKQRIDNRKTKKFIMQSKTQRGVSQTQKQVPQKVELDNVIQRISKYNKLINDIYDSGSRLSTILLKGGVKVKRVNEYKGNIYLIEKFLNRFESKLRKITIQYGSEQDSLNLFTYYEIFPIVKKPSSSDISRSKINPEELESTRDYYIRFFNSPMGEEILKKSIVDTFTQSES